MPASLAYARYLIPSEMASAADARHGFKAPATSDRLPRKKACFADLDLLWRGSPAKSQMPLLVAGEVLVGVAAQVCSLFWELGFWGKRGILTPVLLEKENSDPRGFLAPESSMWSCSVPAFPGSSPLDPRTSLIILTKAWFWYRDGFVILHEDKGVKEEGMANRAAKTKTTEDAENGALGRA